MSLHSYIYFKNVTIIKKDEIISNFLKEFASDINDWIKSILNKEFTCSVVEKDVS